jgi:hypothetical protein
MFYKIGYDITKLGTKLNLLFYECVTKILININEVIKY